MSNEDRMTMNRIGIRARMLDLEVEEQELAFAASRHAAEIARIAAARESLRLEQANLRRRFELDEAEAPAPQPAPEPQPRPDWPPKIEEDPI